MKPYPRLRIFIAFSLCPSLSGLLFSFFFLLDSIFRLDGNRQYVDMPIPQLLLGTIAVLLITGLAAVMFYGIPAIAAAIVYLLLKPYKGWRGFLMTATIGALSAYLWRVIGPLDEPRPMPSLGLGAVTSFIMALLVLPRKTNEIDR